MAKKTARTRKVLPGKRREIATARSESAKKAAAEPAMQRKNTTTEAAPKAAESRLKPKTSARTNSLSESGADKVMRATGKAPATEPSALIAEKVAAEQVAAEKMATELQSDDIQNATQSCLDKVDDSSPAMKSVSAEETQAPAEQGVQAPPRPSLHIVHIAPEMAPVAKVGGLADVVFGLTRELAIRGNQVEIILPKYENLRYDQIWDPHVIYQDLWVPWYEGSIHCSVYFGLVHERKCYFIEPHSADNFFNRESIYGFEDDLLRFAFFSRAAIEFLWKSGEQPDIIHCHDWQTALVPVFLYEMYQALGMTHPRVCLTIHNFKHQGLTGMEMLRATGLHQEEHFFDDSRLQDNNNPYALNLLKGGIVYANFVTTVSPRYAYETQEQAQGFGLEPTLHIHHLSYGGVVNGIDYDVWNPEIDSQIPVCYGVDGIDGKYDNKRALRHRLMLADNEKPIVAFIGRLDPQKGLELVRHAIFYALEHGAQFVLLGSSPEPAINADFWNLKQMLNDSPDCHLEIDFDETLAHLIYAGADMLLVPSLFEPCGLTQLIALRYGTVPIVREVGGLADTVIDKDHSHRPLHERNGYVFQEYDNAGLEQALSRALACYYEHPRDFRELMKNAMRSDYSWNAPGEDYLNIYEHIRVKQA